MEIVNNKAVVLRLRNPSQVTTVIPNSAMLPDGRVAVQWKLENMQILKNLKIKDVPSPILKDYTWPGVYTPFTHQRETSGFLTLHRRAFCFSEQGTGKSASVAWAADYLLNIKAIKRVLIICPLSIMDCAWRSDLFKTTMHRSVDIAYGSADKRKKVIASTAEIVIINYDGVGTVLPELKAGGFDLVVCDEATSLKTATTTRWKNVHALLKTDTWLWLLTGTPAAQSPVDAYGLAKLICPNNVPKFFGAFRDSVMTKITQFKYVPRTDAVERVHAALQPAIRFTKAECLDLPEMLYTKRAVPMSAQQSHYYKILKKKFKMEAAGEEVTATNAAVKLSKLLQVACGAVITDGGESLGFDIDHRFSVLKEVIDDTDQKVIVFVPFKRVIRLLHEKLNNSGYPAEIINGDVPVHERTRIFSEFQNDPTPRVLVIQPQAAAHGVTLTAANTVVWWGPVASVETYEQANARIHRQGQKNKCLVVQLEGSDAERHIYSLLDKNLDIHTRIVDLYKKILD